MAEGLPVDPRLDQAEGEDGLELRGEHEAAADDRVVERLDAEPVAGNQDEAAPRVPYREGEHAAQPLDAALAEILVEVRDDLGVAGRAQGMAAGRELGPQLAVVVDLPVQHHPHRAVLVPDGLAAGREVDDAEPPHPEAHASVDAEALVVGPTMGEGVAHGSELAERHRLIVEADYSRDPAHGSFTSALARVRLAPTPSRARAARSARHSSASSAPVTRSARR